MKRKEYTPGKYWSHTLGSDLEDCHRRIYYRVYASWGGWSRDSDEASRFLYTLKVSDNLPTYSGSLVHEAIQAIMQSVRSERRLGTKEQMLARVEEKMRHEILYSQERKWTKLRNPKKATLILRNHLLGQDLHSTEVDEYIQRAKDSVSAFMDRFLPKFLEMNKEDILLIDSLDSVEHDGYKLFLVPDLVTIRPDKKREVIDWKTGMNPNVDQIKAYAMHLIEWTRREKSIDLDPGQIIGRSITLLNPDNEATVEITQGHIDESMKRIERDIRVLKSLHEEGLKKNEGVFQKTEHTGYCEYCIFKSHCDTTPY